MMSDLSSKTIAIHDNGLFVEWSKVLARKFGRVLYYCPFKSAFPKENLAKIGAGIPNVERVMDFFDIIDETDIFFFPDVYDGDLQLHLRDLGKPVWGSAKGEELELYRSETKDYLRKIGLPVQPVVTVVGLDALREHLKSVNNKYVKISYFRGDMETFHHDTYDLTEPKLDELEYNLGPRKLTKQFVIEDAIDDAVEVGYDGITIDGTFPKRAMQGYEIKDAGYLGAIQDYKDFPPDVVTVNDHLIKAFKAYSYRGFWSTEIRLGKDKKPYLTDPCSRAGSPPNELYMEMCDNWPEVIWAGAHGELVEPNWICKYGCELMIHSDWADKNWQAVRFPKDVAQWVKLRNLTMLNGVSYVVPQSIGLPEIGAVVGIGDTLIEAINNAKEHADKVRGHRINILYDSIPQALKTIEQAQAAGIKFSDDPLPTLNQLNDEDA